ncbi:MAG: Chromate transporter [Haloplasmataceae bacterium]|jgi:chromate transporter|nr:Chromate transporter [Haloplasmataceae bacterium]
MSNIFLLIEIFITFFKIALFNFGGGFAMYSLMEREVVSHGWLTKEMFANIFAISEMTPGPVSINAATYVGFDTIFRETGSILFGLSGSAVATLAIPIPSFIIVVLISPYILKYKDHSLYKMIFYGLKAVVVGLVINAALSVALTTLINPDKYKYTFDTLIENFKDFNVSFNLGSILIFIISYFLLKKLKLNPILVIVISAILGIVVFSL